MKITQISITLMLFFCLQSINLKAELDLLPISIGNYLEPYISQQHQLGFQSAKLVNIITTPYITLSNINYDYEFRLDGDSAGYASFWIATYLDSINNNIVKSFTIYRQKNSSDGGVLVWDTPLLEMFYGFRFVASDNLIVTDEEFSQFIAKLENNSSSIYNDIEAINISENLYAFGAGFPDSIAFKDVSLIDLDKTQQIYYAQTLGNTIKWRFCYLDTVDISCFEETIAIHEENTTIINVYPNPTNKLINFDVPIDQVLNNLELFALNGNLLCKFNTDVTTLDLSAYNTGEYYLCFTLNNTKYYRSIILSK